MFLTVHFLFTSEKKGISLNFFNVLVQGKFLEAARSQHAEINGKLRAIEKQTKQSVNEIFYFFFSIIQNPSFPDIERSVRKRP